MSRRNVWLTFDEWKLINEELSDQKYHPFQLTEKQVKNWKEDIKHYSSYDNRKFERIGVYPVIQQVKSAKAFNILCRENWRSQDMMTTMDSLYDFVGFILTHCNDANMNTTVDQWESVRNRMNDVINQSDKHIWWDNELIKLYEELNK